MLSTVEKVIRQMDNYSELKPDRGPQNLNKYFTTGGFTDNILGANKVNTPSLTVLFPERVFCLGRPALPPASKFHLRVEGDGNGVMTYELAPDMYELIEPHISTIFPAGQDHAPAKEVIKICCDTKTPWHMIQKRAPQEVLESMGLTDTDFIDPRELSAMSKSLFETSFANDAYRDGLLTAQYGVLDFIAYKWIAHNKGSPPWKPTDEEIKQTTSDFIDSAPNVVQGLYLENTMMGHRMTDLVVGSPSTDVLKDYLYSRFSLISKMMAGEIAPGYELMKDAPSELIYTGSFMLNLLRSETFKGDDFDANELVKFALALAKAQHAPDTERLVAVYPVIESRFSCYLNMVLDVVLQHVAPYSFAFGNKATLEGLDMDETDYMHRMRASRTNLEIGAINLDSVRSLIASHPEDVSIASKSVFTAMSEAVNNHREELEKLGIRLNKSVPQLQADFESLFQFNNLAELLKNGTQEQPLIELLNTIYYEVACTPDMLRGTVLAPDGAIDGIVEEARKKQEASLYVVLNRYDGEGSHPIFFDLNADGAQAKIAEATQLIEISPERLTVENLIEGWYTKFPVSYGGLHIFGDVDFCPSPIFLKESVNKRRAEIRILPKKFANQFRESRFPFKWELSDMGGVHIVPGKEPK